MGPEDHLPQELPDSCVAASIRTVRAIRGESSSEGVLREALGPPPRTLGGAARSVGGHHHRLDPDNPSDVEFFLAVSARSWLVAEVRDGPAWHHGRRNLVAPHGALTPAGPTEARGHHAIVITGGPVRLTYQDPWFEARGQPLSVDITSFLQWWWTGDLLLP